MSETELVPITSHATVAHRPVRTKCERPEPMARVTRATARRWRRVAAQWETMQLEIGEAMLRG